MLIENIKRNFTFKRNDGNKIDLVDIDPGMSEQAILDFYSGQYPELTTATIEGPTNNGDSVEYIFSSRLGTKG